MRQNNLTLPSIDSKRIFVTQPSQRRYNRYCKSTKVRGRDKSEIFSKFMDSSIIKKSDFGTTIETERKVNLYDQEEQGLIIPKQSGDRNLRGTKAVFKFYQHYKRLDRILDESKAASVVESPYTAMLDKSQKIMVFPSTIGVVRTKGKGNSISIPNYYVGDHKSQLISAALSKVQGVNELILSKNRLTDKAMGHIMDKISNDLTKLNLSDNKISIIHPGLLKILGTGACQLKYLNLENNRLDDSSIDVMSSVLYLNRSVRYLNVGHNYLTKNCVQSLCLIIESSKCLQQLYIHWNKINGPSVKPIFQKLQANNNIQVFDYSHNIISQGVPSIASSIAQMLLKNKALLHVDLSFNNFTLNQSMEIADGLKKNRTIYGFHFSGNYGYVDCKGFLKFDNGAQNVSSQNSHPKIQSFDVVHRRPKIKMSLQKLKDVCWICQGWSSQQIFHNVNTTTQKFADIYLNYETYKPKTLHIENGWLKLHQMFPPQQILFYFKNNPTSNEFILPEFEVRQQRFDIKIGQEIVKKLIRKVNVLEKRPQNIFENGKINTKVLPRTPDVIRKQAKKRWNFSNSIWAKQWKRQDDETTKKCFQRDWNHSKIPNIVKNLDEQQKVKTFLYQNYKNIKQIYKYFASFSPFDGVWAVSANAFTEFCNEAKIIGKDLPLKIADLTFITTNSMSSADWKTNNMVPQRGLVRFQFLQAVVRLADEKFKKSGNVQTILEAITLMINNHLINVYPKHQTQAWRETTYFSQHVQTLIKKFRPVFANIYRKNSKLKVKPGQKAFMCVQQFKSLCQRSGMFLANTGQRNVFINFNSSFMTQIDQVQNQRIMKITEIQMIQAFARMANDVSFCNLTPDMSQNQKQSRSLHLKLQQLIYVLIQTVCGDDIKNQYPIPTSSIFSSVDSQQQD